MDIHVENPMKPVDELGITGEKRLPQKEKRKQISDNARKTVEEKFNIEKNIEKLLRIYREME